MERSLGTSCQAQVQPQSVGMPAGPSGRRVPLPGLQEGLPVRLGVWWGLAIWAARNPSAVGLGAIGRDGERLRGPQASLGSLELGRGPLNGLSRPRGWSSWQGVGTWCGEPRWGHVGAVLTQLWPAWLGLREQGWEEHTDPVSQQAAGSVPLDAGQQLAAPPAP